MSTTPDSIGDYTDPIIIQGRSGMVRADFEDTTLGSAIITVKNDAGTTLVEAVAVEGTAGVYAYKLGAAYTGTLDRLLVEWTAGEETLRNYVEVCGGYVITLAELESSLPAGLTATLEELAAARILAETALEDACYVSFVPRFRREVNDRGILERGRLRVLREVKVNGTALSSPSSVRVVDRRYIPKQQFFSTFWGDSTLMYPTNLSPQLVEVAYEHGWDEPPALVVRAVARLARYFLTEDPSDYDERATTVTTDTAHYSLITPGVKGAIFALPEANAVVERYGLGDGC